MTLVFVMSLAVVIIFLNYLKEILNVLYKIIKGPDKPKKHMISGAWEDYGEDPFYGFNFISNEVKTGEVVFYDKGSWKGIYWQKISDKDWITSMELNILCGGNHEIFSSWAAKNKRLRNEIN